MGVNLGVDILHPLYNFFMSVNQIYYREAFQLELRKDAKGKPIITNLPIQYVVTFNSKRLKYYSGYRVDAVNFGYEITSDGGVKKKEDSPSIVKRNTFNADKISATIINNRLREIETATKEYFEHNKKTPSTSSLITYLNEKVKGKTIAPDTTSNIPVSIFDFYTQYLKEITLQPSTLKQHNSIKSMFEDFAIEKKLELTFDNTTGETLKGFENWLIERKCSINTISTKLNKIRAFFGYAYKVAKWTQNNPFNDYQKPNELYGTPIILTKAERDVLRDAEINNERLSRVRDLFILQCLIGCRVGDFFTLRKENIVNDTIEYIAEKTKKENARTIKIPLTATAKRIIEKYEYPDGKLMPFISDVKYNLYLKELFVLVELTRLVSWLNPKTRNLEFVPLNKLASSHLARRTFVGIAHKAGLKNEVIASMSGHVANSRAFERYYNIDEKQKRDAINLIE